MREPGGLQELGRDGAHAWGAKVERIVGEALADVAGSHLVPDRAGLPHVIASEWPAMPARVVRCLGRAVALEALDAPGEHGDAGRRRLQEEYLEWRVVRDDDGTIVRIELTTELGAYWRTFAGHAPNELLATVAQFAGEAEVEPAAVFGDCDPFADGTTPQQREDAFAATMLAEDGARSPYNSGARAICCMTHSSNSLTGLTKLAATAGVPRAAEDKEPCLAASELMPRIAGVGKADRASDPLLVERFARLAWDGRLVGFDDPLGVYVRGVESARLRTPGGESVPPEWFSFSRGSAEGGRPRYQRVVLEVPGGEGLRAGDLTDIATEAPIRHGGQVAELLQVGIYLRVSDAGARPPQPVQVAAAAPADPCADVAAAHDELLAGAR